MNAATGPEIKGRDAMHNASALQAD